MGSSVIIAVIVFFYCLSSQLRGDENQWKALPEAWQLTATGWRDDSLLEHSFLLHLHTHTHTEAGLSTCVITQRARTETHKHTSLLASAKGDRYRPRQGFNWSRSQFNASRGLTVIGGRKRWRGEGFGEEIIQPMTLKPTALDDSDSVTWPTKMRQGRWGSTGRDLGSGGMCDIKRNLIPISLWSLWPDLSYF